jgi:hypothetical protein
MNTYQILVLNLLITILKVVQAIWIVYVNKPEELNNLIQKVLDSTRHEMKMSQMRKQETVLTK